MPTCEVCGRDITGTSEFACDHCGESYCREHYADHECDNDGEEPVDDDPEAPGDGNTDDQPASSPPAGDTKYCQECGQELRRDAGFCDRCGADQARAESDADAQPDPADQSGGGISRRKLVGGVVGGVVVGLAGISFLLGVNDSSDVEFGPAADPWANEQRQESATEATSDVDFSVPEGRYAVWTLTPGQRQIQYEYEIATGGNVISVFVVEDSELGRYRDQEGDILHVDSLRGSGSQFSRAAPLSGGDYQLILDNTRVYGEQPNGDVSGELRIRALV